MKKDIKNEIKRRLKIIDGQLHGIQKMVENDEYCIDIIIQTSAVKHAISSVEDLILENHLSTHVIEQVKNGEEKKATEEILSIYKLSKKK